MTTNLLQLTEDLRAARLRVVAEEDGALASAKILIAGTDEVLAERRRQFRAIRSDLRAELVALRETVAAAEAPVQPPTPELVEASFTLSYDVRSWALIVDHFSVADVRLVAALARVTVELRPDGSAHPIYLEVEGNQVMSEVGEMPDRISTGLVLDVAADETVVLNRVPVPLLNLIASATGTAHGWGRVTAS
jgi:hypothetical protein